MKNIIEQKYCVRCNTTKDLKFFSRNKSMPDGYAHYCKDCYKKDYYKYVKHKYVYKPKATPFRGYKETPEKWYKYYKKYITKYKENPIKNAKMTLGCRLTTYFADDKLQMPNRCQCCGVVDKKIYRYITNDLAKEHWVHVIKKDELIKKVQFRCWQCLKKND